MPAVHRRRFRSLPSDAPPGAAGVGAHHLRHQDPQIPYAGGNIHGGVLERNTRAFDRHSIMMFAMPDGLTQGDETYFGNNVTLSDVDKRFASLLYPY